MNPETELVDQATAKPARHTQMRLLEIGNPLAARLGATFFRALPRTPGVYLFYDVNDRLLYIGQSGDLRARIGSYRHVCPERHPRRTLRLVHRIARAEIRICTSAAEAKVLEAELLLHHRPPFNRAGVWQPPPWWLHVDTINSRLLVSLSRQPPSDLSLKIGPLPSSFRYALQALLRCLLRHVRPGLPLSDFPIGLFKAEPPLSFHLPEEVRPQDWLAHLTDCAARKTQHLRVCLEESYAAAPGLTPMELLFWEEQMEAVRRFCDGRPLTTELPLQLFQPVAELPLFAPYHMR